MKRAGLIGATVGVVAGVVFLATEYWWLYAGDSLLTFLFGALIALLFVGALLGLLISLAQMMFPRFRRRAGSFAIGCAVCMGFLFLASLGASEIRFRGLREAAERAAPLIQAIREYEDGNGHPPVSLDVLVPGQMEAIPGTGLGFYPTFDYKTGPGTLAERTGNSWVIYVPASRGPLDWSYFVYCPNQEYDPAELEGAVERVGEWAYVAE